jgi:dephospho-CoA kinase
MRASKHASGPGPLVVGLTGGIGSGKSTCAALFSELGVPVIDADELAHALVAPGEPALADIITEFGPEYLAADGTLDRGKLRQLVFAEPASRHRLEAILHPLIRNNIIQLVDSLQAPYCIVSIPLLLETGQTDLVDRILVIDIPEALQLSRTTARDGLTMDEIRPVLETQADRSTRLAAADDVISNAGSLEELAAKVLGLHQEYLSLSAGN